MIERFSSLQPLLDEYDRGNQRLGTFSDTRATHDAKSDHDNVQNFLEVPADDSPEVEMTVELGVYDVNETEGENRPDLNLPDDIPIVECRDLDRIPPAPSSGICEVEILSGLPREDKSVLITPMDNDDDNDGTCSRDDTYPTASSNSNDVTRKRPRKAIG